MTRTSGKMSIPVAVTRDAMRLIGVRHFGAIFAIALMSSLGVLPFSVAFSADRDRSREIFETHVRPTLVEHCVRCHGDKKQLGGLRLDTRQGWVEGGDSGPAVIPGDMDSLLLQAIGYENVALEMPPRGKLAEPTIRAFKQWVELGAEDPRSDANEPANPDAKGGRPPSIEEGRQFWSFRPVRRPSVPAGGNDWSTSDIDRFVHRRLEENGLHPNQEASRITLLRRLYIDLIGLPPTPEEIESFLAETSTQSYALLVDRLLASPNFGERWGRHWLDVVRFAESSGGGRTLLFPDAWRYRDYVIESFNRDLPFDRFLIEQIAGDLLTEDDWQQRRRNLAATAFLLLGPINYEMQDKEVLEMDIVDEQLDTIGKAMMGMTIGCARCHDHKFDPIPAHDYYAMAGILKSTQSVIHSNVSKWNTENLPMAPGLAKVFERHALELTEAEEALRRTRQLYVQAGGKKKGVRKTQESIAARQIDGIVLDDVDAELVGDWTASTSVGGYIGDRYIHDGSQQRGGKQAIYRHDVETAGRYEVLISYSASSNRSTKVPVLIRHADGESTVRINQRRRPRVEGRFESVGQFRFDAGPTRFIISNDGTTDGVVIADAVVILPADRGKNGIVRATPSSLPEDETKQAVLAKLQAEIDHLEAKVKRIRDRSPKHETVMATVDASEVADVHLAIRGQTHQKGELVPRGVMRVACWDSFPSIPEGQSGRLQLAQWIASSRHPLTARVIVNRVWYWLMGRGIVASLDNFGSMGQRPTHPELLDHLTSDFIEHGWSIKRLIRQIVLSKTYRMSSRPNDASIARDPDNRWYWRNNRKRLRAEDIRDGLLLVSGKLDRRHGGSNIRSGTTIEYGYKFDSTRRSVYVPVFRNKLPEVFEVFDFADPNTQVGHRSASAVASQALWLMNRPSVIEQTAQAAERLVALPFDHHRQRIRYAHLQVLSRPPTDVEMDVAMDLVASTDENDDPAIAQVDRYAMLYRVLFQCVHFRYLN